MTDVAYYVDPPGKRLYSESTKMGKPISTVQAIDVDGVTTMVGDGTDSSSRNI